MAKGVRKAMKRIKSTALLGAVLLGMALLASCAVTPQERQSKETDRSGQIVAGRITATDGNTITLLLGQLENQDGTKNGQTQSGGPFVAGDEIETVNMMEQTLLQAQTQQGTIREAARDELVLGVVVSVEYDQSGIPLTVTIRNAD